MSPRKGRNMEMVMVIDFALNMCHQGLVQGVRTAAFGTMKMQGSNLLGVYVLNF